MNLDDIRNSYLADGISFINAGSRTCQDVVLALIGESHLAKNVTIKGGVVMQHLSGSNRRATQDLDFDFIKYSLNEQSIMSFIDNLSGQTEEISISIIAPFEDLKHQDYNGKRVYIRITDITGTSIDTKLDIGVHKNLEMEQDLFCFDLSKLDDSVTLLINTKEQIFVEKLKSLLKFGVLSTRYKDIFDMYWLIAHGDISNEIVLRDIKLIVFNDKTMSIKNMTDVLTRIDATLSNTDFIKSIGRHKRHNWLEVKPEHIVIVLLDYFKLLND